MVTKPSTEVGWQAIGSLSFNELPLYWKRTEKRIRHGSAETEERTAAQRYIQPSRYGTYLYNGQPFTLGYDEAVK